MKVNFKQSHAGNYAAGRSGPVEYIVIHYTSNQGDTAKNNADYFAREKVGASAHYFCDENEIWQSVKDTDTAWHCGAKTYRHPDCRNANSIGVEICMNDKKGNVRQGSIATAAELVRYLMQRYGVPVDRVIRHYDVTGKYCLPTDSTELLTKSGWKNIKDVKVSDLVASYIPASDSIEFQEVLDTVEPYTDTVIKNRCLEATADHRMYTKPNCRNSTSFRETRWGDILQGGAQHVVKNGAVYHGEGLELSDDEIRFLVWVQGDGHYMEKDGCVYGIEFHLKKDRKILRIKSILEDLGIRYTVCSKSDGSTSIRIYGNEHISFSESWLSGKKFNYSWIEMSERQFDVFWNEILMVDGHLSDRSELYTSAIESNLDVVQAICSTKGCRTNKTTIGHSGGYDRPIALIRTRSNHSVGGSRKTVEKRECEVSCITVPSGYILIRQNGRTFIVGNCPGPMVDDPALWAAFKQSLTQTEDDSVRYKYYDDMPDWAKPTVSKLVKKGYLKGEGGGVLNLTEDTLKVLVVNDRAGCYGE